MMNLLALVEEHGTDLMVKSLFDLFNLRIKSRQAALQFVLEELDAASQGNNIAIQFAEFSGFDKTEYTGAMYNSFDDVDGPNGPQQYLLALCTQLHPNIDLVVDFRIKMVDSVMMKWELGKYSRVDKSVRLIHVVRKQNHLKQGVFANINDDIGPISEGYNILLSMAYGYARRTVVSGLFLQGIIPIEFYLAAWKAFKELQLTTGQSIDFQENALNQAIELLGTYDKRFTKNFVYLVLIAAEKQKNDGSYKNVFPISDEEVFELFE